MSQGCPRLLSSSFKIPLTLYPQKTRLSLHKSAQQNKLCVLPYYKKCSVIFGGAKGNSIAFQHIALLLHVVYNKSRIVKRQNKINIGSKENQFQFHFSCPSLCGLCCSRFVCFFAYQQNSVRPRATGL